MGRNYRKNDVSLTFERRKISFDCELGVDNLPTDNLEFQFPHFFAAIIFGKSVHCWCFEWDMFYVIISTI